MTTSLKVQYLIGTTGFILMAFSGGMVTMASVVGYPPISYLCNNDGDVCSRFGNNNQDAIHHEKD
jgi:hypothetical protein